MNFGFIESISDIEKARKAGNAWILFQGDSGGYTWVTAPITLIKANLRSMYLLMHDLETLEVGGTVFRRFSGEVWVAGYDAWISWKTGQVGEEYQRGWLTDGVWVAPDLGKRDHISAEIAEILAGSRERLSVALSALGSEEGPE